MTDVKESEKLRELEAIARGNGYWNHIEPFVEALTRERDEAKAQLATARGIISRTPLDNLVAAVAAIRALEEDA